MSETGRNKLAEESSPYLTEHADNPVDWYPWGEEALRKAREEDKPIFLSIGYSACHWCHVMKRESFQDPETAELMNRYFVNIKVDREERPDLDEIYMQAVQAMTGRGGWPMSVFLTPELKPFYGGTYFPPEPRRGMPSFKDVLERVHQTFVEKRDEVEENAGQLLNELKRTETLEGSDEVPGDEYLQRVYEQLEEQFDPEWGGFGSAPKFPRVMDLQLLLRLSRDDSEYPEAQAMLSRTLDTMMNGGIYDQIGGGFARYSTDRKWLVPHFEKMLYDNAQLVDCYARAYRRLGEPSYRRVVEQTMGYVQREMTHPEGGFYSTQDAESEGVEGKYYLWEYEEFMDAVGEHADMLADYYNVTREGNFEGKNILHVTESASVFCDQHGCDPEELKSILRQTRERLLQVREQRVRPHRDEKILTDWNGLMAAACARAGFLLGTPAYIRMAEEALEYVFDHAAEDGELFHVTKNGRSHTPGFLDDYAFTVKALIQQFQCTGELDWLRRGRQYFERAVEAFWDVDRGGFYMTGPRHEHPIVRSKSAQDKAQPSGNSEMVLNALKLAELTGERRYRNYAGEILTVFDRYLDRAPTSVTRMLCGLHDYHGEAREIVIVGGPTERSPYLDVVRRLDPDNTVLFQTDTEDERVREETNLLEGREEGPRPAAYLCRGGSCRQPATSPEVFEQQVEELLSG